MTGIKAVVVVCGIMALLAGAGPRGVWAKDPVKEAKQALQKGDVTIQVNDTPIADDDMVMLRDSNCPDVDRPTVKCQVILKAAQATDTIIVLSCPDLRFPNETDTTKAVTIMAGGTAADFLISGETASANIGDATIKADLGTKDPVTGAITDTGTLLGEQKCTVFQISPSSMTVTTGHAYMLGAGVFAPDGVYGNPAVNLSATGSVSPAKLDMTQPQLVNLKIGIAQSSAAQCTHIVQYSNPIVNWNAGVGCGTVTAPYAISLEWFTSVPANTMDCVTTGDAPVYNQKAPALQPPGGAAATTTDGPSIAGIVAAVKVDLTDGAGTIVGSITYSNPVAAINDAYSDWSVSFDSVTKAVRAWKSAGWTLNVNSVALGSAVPGPAEGVAP